MVDPAPAHVGDVQQAVDAAQVDEGAEVGDVLDGALADLADGDLREELLLLLFAGDLDQLAAADDDVAPALVDLEDHALDLLIDIIGDVGGAADVDLAGGQEDVDADIDQQAALDLAGDSALDDVAFVVAGDDHLPGAHPVRFLRERTISPVSSSMPSSRTSTLSPVHRRRLVLPLVERDEALGLVADVDDDLVADDLDDLARDDPADLEALALAQELVEACSVPSSPVTRAVSSSSLTSNSRSRLRSTMFDFASIPPPGNEGDGPPQKPPKSHFLGSIESPIDARRKSRLRLLQRINVSETRKPTLHARGGLFQRSIIGPAAPNTTRVGASSRPVRRAPPARVHVPSARPNRSPAVMAPRTGAAGPTSTLIALTECGRPYSLPLLSAEPRRCRGPRAGGRPPFGKGDVACGCGAWPRLRPRRVCWPSPAARPPRLSPGDRSPPVRPQRRSSRPSSRRATPPAGPCRISNSRRAR